MAGEDDESRRSHERQDEEVAMTGGREEFRGELG
jgi:hypothetical protein